MGVEMMVPTAVNVLIPRHTPRKPTETTNSRVISLPLKMDNKSCSKDDVPTVKLSYSKVLSNPKKSDSSTIASSPGPPSPRRYSRCEVSTTPVQSEDLLNSSISEKKEVKETKEKKLEDNDYLEYKISLDEVITEFRRHLNINEITNCTGLNVLHQAAVSGNHYVLEYCIEKEFYDIDSVDDCGCTPILLATQKKYQKCVALLTKAGANVFKRNKAGVSAVNLVGNGKYENTNILFVVISSLNRSLMLSGISSKDMLDRLVEAKWNLIYIMMLNRPILFEMAVSSNVLDVNARDSRGRTALHWAVATKTNPTWVRILLLGGANTNIRDHDGYYPIHHPVLTKKYPSVLRQLISYDSDIYMLDNEGRMQCVFLFKHGLVDALLEMPKRLDFEARDLHGDTILHYAAHNPNPDIAEFMVQHKIADLNPTNHKGDTPLHIAARYANAKFIVMILDENADPNIRNSRDQTPLELVLKNKRLNKSEICDLAGEFYRCGAKDFELLEEFTRNFEDEENGNLTDSFMNDINSLYENYKS